MQQQGEGKEQGEAVDDQQGVLLEPGPHPIQPPKRLPSKLSHPLQTTAPFLLTARAKFSLPLRNLNQKTRKQFNLDKKTCSNISPETGQCMPLPSMPGIVATSSFNPTFVKTTSLQEALVTVFLKSERKIQFTLDFFRQECRIGSAKRRLV